MKKTLISFAIIAISSLASAQITVELKIEGVEQDKGKIFVSIFNSEPTYKVREPYLSFSINANNEGVTKELNLLAGQYVISIFQDSNGNGKLDTNVIGIPKEKFGFTNYDGKSAPGNFNNHKVEVNENSKNIIVKLHKI